MSSIVMASGVGLTPLLTDLPFVREFILVTSVV